jgi:hypothetical protein
MDARGLRRSRDDYGRFNTIDERRKRTTIRLHFDDEMHCIRVAAGTNECQFLDLAILVAAIEYVYTRTCDY